MIRLVMVCMVILIFISGCEDHGRGSYDYLEVYDANGNLRYEGWCAMYYRSQLGLEVDLSYDSKDNNRVIVRLGVGWEVRAQNKAIRTSADWKRAKAEGKRPFHRIEEE